MIKPKIKMISSYNMTNAEQTAIFRAGKRLTHHFASKSYLYVFTTTGKWRFHSPFKQFHFCCGTYFDMNREKIVWIMEQVE